MVAIILTAAIVNSWIVFMCIGLRDLNILFNELSPQAHKAGITSLYG
jgi:hypothetical protein